MDPFRGEKESCFGKRGWKSGLSDVGSFLKLLPLPLTSSSSSSRVATLQTLCRFKTTQRRRRRRQRRRPNDTERGSSQKRLTKVGRSRRNETQLITVGTERLWLEAKLNESFFSFHYQKCLNKTKCLTSPQNVQNPKICAKMVLRFLE